jgi:hypothetical protein
MIALKKVQGKGGKGRGADLSTSLSASKDAVSLQWKGPANAFDTCLRLSPDYRGQRS